VGGRKKGATVNTWGILIVFLLVCPGVAGAAPPSGEGNRGWYCEHGKTLDFSIVGCSCPQEGGFMDGLMLARYFHTYKALAQTIFCWDCGEEQLATVIRPEDPIRIHFCAACGSLNHTGWATWITYDWKAKGERQARWRKGQQTKKWKGGMP
jgi:hypothetical protein